MPKMYYGVISSLNLRLTSTKLFLWEIGDKNNLVDTRRRKKEEEKNERKKRGKKYGGEKKRKWKKGIWKNEKIHSYINI